MSLHCICPASSSEAPRDFPSPCGSAGVAACCVACSALQEGCGNSSSGLHSCVPDDTLTPLPSFCDWTQGLIQLALNSVCPEDDLKLLIFPPTPPKCQKYRCAASCPAWGSSYCFEIVLGSSHFKHLKTPETHSLKVLHVL